MMQPPLREFSNLVELLASSVEAFGARPLFGRVCDGSVAWTTFAEFGALVDRFRAGLAQLDIGPGARVGVISSNRLEWAVGAYACFGLGAVYVPLYEAQPKAQWRYVLRDSGCVACIAATSQIASQLRDLQSELPELNHVIDLEGAFGEPKTYRTLLAAGGYAELDASAPDPDQAAIIYYGASGYGTPLPVVLTHRNLASALRSLLARPVIDRDDCSMALLPWAQAYGCLELNLSLGTGASVVSCSDAARLSEYLSIVKPTALFAMPIVWRKVYEGVMAKLEDAPAPVREVFHAGLEGKRKLRAGQTLGAAEQQTVATAEQFIFPAVRGALGGGLRLALCFSWPVVLAREVGEFLQAIGISFDEHHGLLETCGVALAQPLDAPRPGSVGVALAGVRFELDAECRTCEGEGELIIYGDNVTPRFEGRPHATLERLTADGGLRTGDLARIDADGYVYLTGRMTSDFHMANGRLVAPEPIECLLEHSLYIQEVVVTSLDGWRIVGVIIPQMELVRSWAEARGLKGDDACLLSAPEVVALFDFEVARCGAAGEQRLTRFLLDSEPFTPENGLRTWTWMLKRRAVFAKYRTALAAL